MEDNTIKQIIINPELFNLSGKKNKNKTSKIIFNDSNKLKNKSISNNPKTKILKHIQNIYNQ
jgi:hypothetical protein